MDRVMYRTDVRGVRWTVVRSGAHSSFQIRRNGEPIDAADTYDEALANLRKRTRRTRADGAR